MNSNVLQGKNVRLRNTFVSLSYMTSICRNISFCPVYGNRLNNHNVDWFVCIHFVTSVFHSQRGKFCINQRFFSMHASLNWFHVSFFFTETQNLSLHKVAYRQDKYEQTMNDEKYECLRYSFLSLNSRAQGQTNEQNAPRPVKGQFELQIFNYWRNNCSVMS